MLASQVCGTITARTQFAIALRLLLFAGFLHSATALLLPPNEAGKFNGNGHTTTRRNGFRPRRHREPTAQTCPRLTSMTYLASLAKRWGGSGEAPAWMATTATKPSAMRSEPSCARLAQTPRRSEPYMSELRRLRLDRGLTGRPCAEGGRLRGGRPVRARQPSRMSKRSRRALPRA